MTIRFSALFASLLIGLFAAVSILPQPAFAEGASVAVGDSSPPTQIAAKKKKKKKKKKKRKSRKKKGVNKPKENSGSREKQTPATLYKEAIDNSHGFCNVVQYFRWADIENVEWRTIEYRDAVEGGTSTRILSPPSFDDEIVFGELEVVANAGEHHYLVEYHTRTSACEPEDFQPETDRYSKGKVIYKPLKVK